MSEPPHKVPWNFHGVSIVNESTPELPPDIEPGGLPPLPPGAEPYAAADPAEWKYIPPSAHVIEQGFNNDPVNPDHYGRGTYETIKVIHAWGLGFSLGNAVKYISRAGKKDPSKEIEDLRKAIWYIEDHIKRLGGES